MTQKVSAQTTRPSAWGLLCDRWFLVQTEGLSITHERIGVGCGGVEAVRQRTPQFFYVLQGKAAIQVNGTELLLSRREGCLVPAGAPHRLRNGGSEELHCLVISGGEGHVADADPAADTVAGEPAPSAV